MLCHTLSALRTFIELYSEILMLIQIINFKLTCTLYLSEKTYDHFGALVEIDNDANKTKQMKNVPIITINHQYIITNKLITHSRNNIAVITDFHLPPETTKYNFGSYKQIDTSWGPRKYVINYAKSLCESNTNTREDFQNIFH